MKKSLAYIAMAVVLGTALMLTPIWLYPVVIQYRAAPNHYPSPSFAEATQRLSKDSEAFAGVKVNQPMDAISVSLMLTVSLVLALSASLHLKKRMPSVSV